MSDCRNGTGELHHVSAEVGLYAPDGSGPWGFMCREHAEAAIAEYAAKLAEAWTMAEARP